jgi:hypothetical protein
MPSIVDRRFDFVHVALHRCNQSISELLYISEAKETKEEAAFASHHPFQMYCIALHYFFNAEFNKLLEPKKNPKFPDNHIASVILINDYFKETVGERFESTFKENKQILAQVSDTEFSKYQRLLRDKRFSHGDLHEVNNPFSFPIMKDEEIQDGIDHLKLLFQVLNNCGRIFNFDIDTEVPNRDHRTRNFIHYQSVYERYYQANYVRAYNEGFGIR